MMASRTGSRGVALALGLWLCLALPAGAQAPAGEAGLPRGLAEEIFEFFNRRETIRVTGDSRIGPGSEVVGDIALLGGPLTVAGRLRGRLVAINADVHLEAGAEVSGDLTVVGGTVSGLEGATVGGEVRVYREPLRFRLDRGRLAAATPPHDPELTAGREFGFGRTDLTLAARRGYNRVEGLPIALGPRFETRGSNPLRAEALLIYRTATGLDPDADELGYGVRLEQFLGGRRRARIGASLFSEIVPIEARGLSDRENSLATFLLRHDFRDHYEREGWNAYLRWTSGAGAHDLELEFRSEEHRTVAAREPWAPFGSRAWRRQPRIADGTLRSLAARTTYDTRNEGGDPSTGWLVEVELERGLGGRLVHAVPGQQDSDDFATLLIDARRYARLGPTSRLAIRTRVAGTLNRRPLPPQRQHALGGEGSLPGYDLLRFDCGARAGAPGPAAFYPYYGCDRMALVQLEYHNDLPLGRGWGRMLGGDVDLGEVPGWVIFFDAGRAWTEREARAGRTGGQDDFAADAGLGLRFGRLGFYWAVPLSGSDKGINFFVRLGARL